MVIIMIMTLLGDNNDNDGATAVLILQMTEYDDTKYVECRYCVCARQQDRHTIEVNIGLPPFSTALSLFPTQQIKNLYVHYIHIILYDVIRHYYVANITLNSIIYFV